MPSFRQALIAFLVAASLVACRSDPNVAKKRYLESGNSYFDHGNYTAARIQYGNSIKADNKYGPAHYKLALTYMKQKQGAMALREYRKAVELLKSDQAYQVEYKQALIELAGLNIIYRWKEEEARKEVERYCDELLKKDPNSFDAYRLTGDLDVKKSQVELTPSVQLGLLDKAMENYRKADSIKPGDPAVSLQIAALLVFQKHFAEAEPYFRKVIDKDKTSAGAYVGLYRLYMAEAKAAEAEQLLKEAAQNNPKTHEYLQMLAFHYGSMGRREDMLNVLQQIKSHSKDFDAVYQVVGNFYLRLGDMDSAMREYREGITKDPKRKSEYQHAIIEVLTRQGKRAEAAEVNAQILKENPKDAEAKSMAAKFLLDRGDVATALAQLQALVTSSPDNAAARYELGRAYLASGRQDSQELARQAFQKAIELRPDMINPRLGLAELQVAHGEYEAALDSIQEILSRDPGNVNAKLIQSRAFLGQKKFGESDNVVGAMMKANPSSPEVFYQAGISALTQGRAKDAEAAFMRSYQLNPANAKGLMGVVDSLIDQGKPDDAMNQLLTESKKAPNRVDILFLLGTTAKRLGKYQEALDYFTKVISGLDKKAPFRADLYMQIADTYRLKGDRDNSVNNYQKAREILPDNATVLRSLGVVLDTSGRKPEARQAYEASLKIVPSDAFVLNNLAYLMAETGADLDIALNDAQKAKSLAPNRPEISDTVGWILLKKNLAENAIQTFKDLVSRFPNVSTYHYHLAIGYNQKSDSTHAIAELKEALRCSPSADEQQKIQEMLGKLGAK